MVVAVIALFTPLGPLVLALVAIKLARPSPSTPPQWPSPESGQTIGLLDVALDATDLLGAAGDVVKAGRARAAASAVRAADRLGGGGRGRRRAQRPSTPRPTRRAARRRRQPRSPSAVGPARPTTASAAGTRRRLPGDRAERRGPGRPYIAALGDRQRGKHLDRDGYPEAVPRAADAALACGTTISSRQPWRRSLDGAIGRGRQRSTRQNGWHRLMLGPRSCALLNRASDALGQPARTSGAPAPRGRTSWRAARLPQTWTRDSTGAVLRRQRPRRRSRAVGRALRGGARRPPRRRDVPSPWPRSAARARHRGRRQSSASTPRPARSRSRTGATRTGPTRCTADYEVTTGASPSSVGAVNGGLSSATGRPPVPFVLGGESRWPTSMPSMPRSAAGPRYFAVQRVDPADGARSPLGSSTEPCDDRGARAGRAARDRAVESRGLSVALRNRLQQPPLRRTADFGPVT